MEYIYYTKRVSCLNGEVRSYGWGFNANLYRSAQRFTTDAKRGYTNVGFRI